MPSLTRKIAEGSFLLSSKNLIVNLTGLVTTIILVRYLGKFEYGLYALFMSAVAIARLGLLNMIKGVVVADTAREIGRKEFGNVKSLLFRFSQVQIALAVLISVILLFLSQPVFMHYGSRVGELVLIIAVLMPLYGIQNIFKATFSSHAEFKSLGVIDVIENASRLLFIAVMVIGFKFGLFAAAGAHIFGVGISIVLASSPALGIVGYLKRIERTKTGLFSRMLKGHGKFNIFLEPVQKVKMHGIPWVIQFFIGVEAVAVFSVAKRGMTFFNNLMKPIGGVYLPLVSSELSKGVERVNEMVSRGIKYLLAVSFSIVSVTFVIAPFIFEILFGVEYLESVPLFRIFLLNLLIFPMAFVIRPIFMAYKGQRYLFYSMGVSTIALLGSMGVLIPMIGLKGAVVGFILGNFIWLVCLLYHLKGLDPGLKIDTRLIFSFDNYDRWLVRKIYGKVRNKFL